MVSFPPVSPPRPIHPPLLTHTRHMPSPSHSFRFIPLTSIICVPFLSSCFFEYLIFFFLLTGLHNYFSICILLEYSCHLILFLYFSYNLFGSLVNAFLSLALYLFSYCILIFRLLVLQVPHSSSRFNLFILYIFSLFNYPFL